MPTSRIRLTPALWSWIPGLARFVTVSDEGLAVQERGTTRFLPYARVESLQRGRPGDAFVVVCDDGARLAIPDSVGPAADTLAETIRTAAHLEWVHLDNERVPKMAVRPRAMSQLHEAFRTWSRVD